MENNLSFHSTEGVFCNLVRVKTAKLKSYSENLTNLVRNLMD